MALTRHRGARPSPRHKLAAAAPHLPRLGVPDSFGIVPSQLSMWGNSQYGDCVSAEEAFAKAAYAIQCGLPELFISEAEVIAWAGAHGFLNGADLSEVMAAMAQSGMAAGGSTYGDGPPNSVDWTNDAALSSAIWTGPVKIAVAADQLEKVVRSTNGWFATGFSKDSNTDHCVSLCGFGTIAQCAALLKVPTPAGANPAAPGNLLFTWSTIGIIDQPSRLAITSEAWLRNPTTPGYPPPNPAPTPPPSPTPTPIPTPINLGEIIIDSTHKEVAVPAGLPIVRNVNQVVYHLDGTPRVNVPPEATGWKVVDAVQAPAIAISPATKVVACGKAITIVHTNPNAVIFYPGMHEVSLPPGWGTLH